MASKSTVKKMTCLALKCAKKFFVHLLMPLMAWGELFGTQGQELSKVINLKSFQVGKCSGFRFDDLPFRDSGVRSPGYD